MSMRSASQPIFPPIVDSLGLVNEKKMGIATSVIILENNFASVTSCNRMTI